jgi:putative FmdB family regulatory protein
MPIYCYRCTNCGHAQDVLQKVSDAPLTVCPACGEPAYAKQVTAAGFQLKGSGWYVTDFKGGKAPKQEQGEGKPAAESEKKAAAVDKADAAGKGSAGGDKPAGDAAASTAPKPADAPAGPAPSSGG